MIHDAKVEVTCDARWCNSFEYIDLEWKYTDYSGNNGYYDSNENDIEAKLLDLDWVVYPCQPKENDTEIKTYHFCCEDCYLNSRNLINEE